VGSKYDQEAIKGGVEDHVVEEFVVFESYTIGYPRTMMVHFKNAFIAL
jgi:hypothetical protein